MKTLMMNSQLILKWFILNHKFISCRIFVQLTQHFFKFCLNKYCHLACTNDVALEHANLKNKIKLDLFCLNTIHINLPIWKILLQYESITQLIQDLLITKNYKIELLLRLHTCQKHNSKPKSNYIDFISYNPSMHPKRFNLPFNTHQLLLCPCLNYSKSYLYYTLLKYITLSEHSENVQLQMCQTFNFQKCTEMFVSDITRVNVTLQLKHFTPLYMDEDYMFTTTHITSLQRITNLPLIVIPLQLPYINSNL